ncbi:MAG: glycosyltransferase family 39 protein, partial [Elusimicrobia bacterium]|nr:glycosyltransferase family 39 protein [Elusimicrobiota bacterium]
MDESDYRVSKDASPFDDFNEAEAVELQPVRRSNPRTIAASLAGLFLLIAFHAAQTAHWVRHDTRPPAWDQSVQPETAWDLKEALAKGDLAGALRMRPKPGMPPFPLLYHFSIQPALSSPDPVAAALWVNWAYLALLCVALWGLGRHFLGEWEGLGAAVLFTCVPELGWLQREVLVDIPLTAWVACAYWALAASDGFRKKAPSALFGLCFGAAMMTKWSAFSFFLPAVIPFWSALTGFGKAAPLLAAGLAGLVCLPWYIAQAPILLPRLFEAAADQAVPVWKGGAAFTYVFLMGSGLEVPLLVLGVGGAFVPTAKRRNEDHWLLPAWFLTSLLFWTIVPNRQLRYLLPGLVPLGVLAMGPWPKQLSIAACALSLLMAWNYPRAVLPHLTVGGVPVSLFRSDKPVKEAWPLGDILKAAAERRDTELPFANLAFVANHPRFNGPVLNWERKHLGLDGLRIRGVTKRTTELCEFVVVKAGDLGPASVTGQLPEVQKVMLDAGRWFGRGWKEVKSFPFPDGTQAVLFQRRKLSAPPIPPGKVTVAYYEEGHFKAEGMVLDFGPWDAERGVYKTVGVRADT